jgi:hypothetical protein
MLIYIHTHNTVPQMPSSLKATHWHTQTVQTSVATVMTDVFHKNEINLLRKFAKIVRIFDKIDDFKNRGVI